MKTIDPDIFTSLIRHYTVIECNNEGIYIEFEYTNYNVSCYSNCFDDKELKLTIESCAKKINSKWESRKLLEVQLDYIKALMIVLADCYLYNEEQRNKEIEVNEYEQLKGYDYEL